MEPFALKSGRRLQLHWWVIAGVAAAFFVWSFDLIPRVRSAATGSVASSRQSSGDSSEVPLEGDWSPSVYPGSQTHQAADDGLAEEDLTNPFRDGSQPAFEVFEEPDPEHVAAEDVGGNRIRSASRRDSRVETASYESDENYRDTVTPVSRRETAPPVIPAAIAEKIRLVDDWFEEDRLLDAHAELSRIYWKHPELRTVIQDRIDASAAVIFTKSDRQFGPPHFVEYGETLDSIARLYDVPWEYLAMLNRVTPQKLQAGQELKVVRGPFGAVVDLEEFTLTVHAHGWYVNHYAIGTGRDDRTPLGEFTIREKLENPVWYNPDGGIVEADDPENPLGEYWMGLGDHIGIHGTNDPATIGRAASRGCIHLGENDIAEVFSLLGTGSKVMIRK